ncbi:Eco57I restriction-modification methylase domain-containing protein [Planococcus halotolerans]|uniref:Eco57I restriction-modification methylase domain-containing protein n=1 Tax=Planococcus halotolerans TaxID=2233542 RepID=UPI001091F15E|nr:hypothetical protein [Planococcus halotolerans]QHJ69222.1 hypothetical protein DNR44_000560 [Planococcus halotolerans]
MGMKEVLKDVETDTSLFIINKKEIENEIQKFNNILFKSRTELFPSRNSEELYKETISITTDILFILLAKNRNLLDFNLIQRDENEAESLIKSIILNLTLQDLKNEKWPTNCKIALLNLLELLGEKAITQTEILSCLVEDIGEKSEESSNASKNGSSQKRRQSGSYYTQNELIDVIIKNTIDPLCDSKSNQEILQIKVIDPAVGSGVFLTAALNRIVFHYENNSTEALSSETRIEVKRKVVENCLYGVDLNTNALKASMYSLWLEVGDRTLPLSTFEAQLVEGDSLLAVHWDLQETHADIKNLKKANYYIIGKLLKGEEIKDWYKIYETFNNSNLEESELDLDQEMLINLGKDSKTFIWQLEFQDVYDSRGGFDAVVGNPPWNKVKVHIKEFFEHYDISIKGMQGDQLKKYIIENFLVKEEFKKIWKDHESSVKAYSNAVNSSPHYKHQTSIVNGKRLGGDRDLYKYFVELSYLLVREDGLVGLILPAAIIQSEGTTGLRELLLFHAQIELLLTVENRDSIFPIDSRFKYALAVFKKSKTPRNTIKCRFMLKSIQEVEAVLDEKSFIEIPRESIELLSANTKALPDIKTQYEIDLLKRIYENHPIINSPSGWKMSFNRELDMTNNSNLFVHSEIVNKLKEEKRRIDFVPLYEGRMVHQFDFSAKKYISGEGRKAKWIDLKWNEKEIAPHFYVEKIDAEKRFSDYKNARPAYCDIAGQTNERAVQTALIPGNTIAGNKVPTVNIHPHNIAADLLWIALTNSFVFDWMMRLRIATTINFFHWNQIPLPVIDFYSDMAKKIVKYSARLSLVSSEMEESRVRVTEFYKGDITLEELNPCTDPVERQVLRAEIDAEVAKLYKLNIEDLAYILYQFPLLDRNQPSIPGDYSINLKKKASFITRDSILLKFLQNSDLSGEVDIVKIYKRCGINVEKITSNIRRISERVKKAHELGAIAYMPGENKDN